MTTDRKITGEDITKIRKMLGLSQGDFARLTGYSRQTINKFEQEAGEMIDSGPARRMFVLLAELLSVASGATIAFVQESIQRNLKAEKKPLLGERDDELLYWTVKGLVTS